MEREKPIWEYERNAISNALNEVKKNLSSNLNNKMIPAVVHAMRMNINSVGKRENWKFLFDSNCLIEEEWEKYLIINDIPYPEIKWNQTDVGYQVITKDWKDYIFIWEFVNWKKEWHCIRYSDWWMFEWEFKNDEPINNYR